MPDQFTKQLTPQILAKFITGRCSYGQFTLDAAETDADDTTFTGEVSLDQLTDAINEHFGMFPNGHHEVGNCGKHNPDAECYFCRKENVASA